MKKPELIEALRAKGAEFDENENYGRLLHLLKTLQEPAAEKVTIETRPATEDEQKSIEAIIKEPKQIKFLSKINKRDHGHISDAYRDDLDNNVLRLEMNKLGYRPKVKTITRIKHIDLTAEGEYVTEFILDMKE